MAPSITPDNAPLKDKVDIFLGLLVMQSELLSKNQLKIEQLEKDNAVMKSTINSLSSEVFVLKNASNRREQISLSNSMSDEEANATDGGPQLQDLRESSQTSVTGGQGEGYKCLQHHRLLLLGGEALD
jgi:hypothetical protein